MICEAYPDPAIRSFGLWPDDAGVRESYKRMLKPVVLNRGAATGTWSIKKSRPEPAWFARPTPAPALARETADIERFLAS